MREFPSVVPFKAGPHALDPAELIVGLGGLYVVAAQQLAGLPGSPWDRSSVPRTANPLGGEQIPLAVSAQRAEELLPSVTAFSEIQAG